MAVITDYDTLITAVGDELKRTDLTSAIPRWIVDAEAVMNYGNEDMGVEGLRTASQETLWTSASTTPAITVAGSQTVTLPSDVLEFREPLYLTVGGTRRELVNVSSAPMSTLTLSNAAGVPETYWIRGNKLYFDCPADAAYPLTGDYYTTIGPLNSTNTTNWLLTLNPDIYLSGAIACGGMWLGPTFNVGPWLQRFKGRIAQISRFDERKRYRNVRMRSEVSGMLDGGYSYSDFVTGR
jgi:hypothetical protein